MPDVTAEGSLALGFEKLAALVALSPTFQAGRGYAQTLAESVDWRWRDAEDQRKPTRPFATVDDGGLHGYDLIAGGVQNVLRPRGAAFLYLERDWPAAYLDDVTNASRDSSTWFGKIIDEIAANAGLDIGDQIGGPFSDGSGDLSIVRINRVFFESVDPDDWDRDEWYFACGYQIEWGDG